MKLGDKVVWKDPIKRKEHPDPLVIWYSRHNTETGIGAFQLHGNGSEPATWYLDTDFEPYHQPTGLWKCRQCGSEYQMGSPEKPKLGAVCTRCWRHGNLMADCDWVVRDEHVTN